MTFRPKIL